VAFKIGNQTVIHDADATAAIETNSNLDRLQINGTDVLIHDGTTVTLKNVNINDLMEASINTDNVTEGTANLFYTTARQTAIENYSDQSELDAVLTANAYTDTREVAITTALQSYADTAEADAVLTANAYTDTREVAITTALQSYADTAEADAKAYTDTEVATVLPLTGGTLTGALVLSGAPSSANHASTKAYVDSTISSGTGALDTDDIPEAGNLYYTDARVNSYLSTNNFSTQSYVDTAEADAIVSANTYTDTREVAITTAYQTYADTAEVDAKAYTDTRETAITTAYQTYADQAETDAKAYTDIEVAAIVDGAPGTLDTLNELAAALGDDANLSTTLSTQIGTKLATADFNSTANTWLGSNLYYTDERVDDRVSNLLVAGSNITLTYNDSLNTMTIASATTASGGYDLSSNTTDDVTEGASNLYFTTARTQAVSINNLVEDTTPQLGGNLDLQTHAITTSEDGFDITTGSGSDELAIGVGSITGTGWSGQGIGIASSVNAGTDILLLGDMDYTSGIYVGEFIGQIAIDSATGKEGWFGLSTVTENSSSYVANTIFSAEPQIILSNVGTSNEVGLAVGTGSDARIHQLDSSGNTIFKLPAADGSANQVLKTDGNGDLSWVAQTTNTDTNTTYTAGTGLNLVGTEFQNTAPDQTVSLTGSGATSISGTYPNFTISSTDTNTDTNTTYSTATSSTLGLVKIGYVESGKNYPVELSSGKMFVNVPWVDTNTDTNTTYTAGNGLTLTGTQFKMSGSYTGDFTASGDVTAYSDERLKSNITTIEDALDKVKAMRGVMFDKTNSLTGELRQSTGVIAQETEEVLPEVVHNDDNTGYKSVAYGNIVGVLIEAIKEQQSQIEDLTKEVEFLKGQR
jgi:hypothetical protein